MARAVNWVLAGIDVLARSLGVSARTARRKAAAMPGAVKTGGGWIVPMRVSEYARGAGVSERTARRRAVAKAASPTAPAVQAHVPRAPSGRGPIKTSFSKRMVNSRLWPYQYQGFAWIMFLASGDIIQWFSGVIVSKTALTWRAIDSAIRSEARKVFGSSPMKILNTGLVYAHHG